MAININNQLLIDFAATKFADKIGYRTCVTASQVLSAFGLALMAFLALAGDLDATVSPALVGSISEMAGSNLKMGLLVATVFPVVLIADLMVLKKWYKNS